MKNAPKSATARAERSGIAILEEAVFLLKCLPLRLLVPYFAGTLPFVLGLLYFWGDMSQSAFAVDRLIPASLGMAFLFIWMKGLQSVFARQLLAYIGGIDSPRNPDESAFRRTAFQMVMHASSFLILPLSLVITLPYGWVYAFYQNCLVADCPNDHGFSRILSDTVKTASVHPRQNHMVILILFLFKMVVMLNIGMVVYALPQMAKSLFGVESVFTVGGFRPMNSTFLISVLCLTHVCVDPLVKTVYTLRFFYGRSETSGDDLKAELKKIALAARLALVVLSFAATLLFHPLSAVANTEDVLSQSGPAVTEMSLSPDTLEASVHEVLNRRDFAWRMPRDKQTADTESGLLDAFFNWIGPPIKAFFKRVAGWGKAAMAWLEKFFPKPKTAPDIKGHGQSPLVRYLLYILLGLTLVVLIVMAVRHLVARRRTVLTDSVESVPVVDVSDENVIADQLPSDSWRMLAKNLLEKGEFRLAMRALYLGTLARLSEKGLITVAHYKSNRDYTNELVRRAHQATDMIDLFRLSVGQFEKIWYGMHPVGNEDVIGFAENQERIVGHAQ